jgi:hypothetical protein
MVIRAIVASIFVVVLALSDVSGAGESSTSPGSPTRGRGGLEGSQGDVFDPRRLPAYDAVARHLMGLRR